MHQKRLTISKLWPIPRKGNTFIAVANNNKNTGIPVIIAMRDILGHVQTKKELKKIILEGKVEVNGHKIKDERYSLLLYDILGLPGLKKYYRVSLSPLRKIAFEEANEKDAGIKISKVISKKTLSKGTIQINLRDGRNLLVKDKIDVGNSVIINLKDKKIEKVLPIKEKSEVLVIKGKHLGNKGKIISIEDKNVNVSFNDGEYNLNIDSIMVLN